MKNHALLLLLLVCVCTHGAPVDQLKPGSCEDPSVLGAAKLALTKINQERKKGYIFSLNRLCNVNQMPQEPTGMVYYLTLDVLETKCHVLSKRENCEVRQIENTPVYGQCTATIYINKIQRVVRLYSYSCTVRPAPASKILRMCPDCPSLFPIDSETTIKTVKSSLEEFNKKSGLSNYFALLNVTRASVQRGIATFDFVEFTIQETVCPNNTDLKNIGNCKLMDCEFAHKGFCKGTRSEFMGSEDFTVNCDIFETEEAEKEKSRHLLGGEHKHSHSHEHGAGHSHNHGHCHSHEHDHKHDNTHDHSHCHSHEHDHVHEHPGHHHHGHNHTHEHEHTHLHLHAHEHHHYPIHASRMATAKAPRGTVRYLPSMDNPEPASSSLDPHTHHAVTLPLFPDAHGDGLQNKEPVILPFPSTMSLQCPGKSNSEVTFIIKLFEEDPLFQHKAH